MSFELPADDDGPEIALNPNVITMTHMAKSNSSTSLEQTPTPARKPLRLPDLHLDLCISKNLFKLGLHTVYTHYLRECFYVETAQVCSSVPSPKSPMPRSEPKTSIACCKKCCVDNFKQNPLRVSALEETSKLSRFGSIYLYIFIFIK